MTSDLCNVDYGSVKHKNSRGHLNCHEKKLAMPTLLLADLVTNSPDAVLAVYAVWCLPEAEKRCCAASDASPESITV